jgi:flagella basal body P-ring formation protein FlgA
MVEEPPVVQKGSKVMIKAESDRILITTIGRALEDGRNGDLVKVVNVNSGKEIVARVKGPELVVVSF